MKVSGAREESNTMKENDNTNRSCREKNLNPGRSTAPQLRSPTLGMQFIKLLLVN
jgi:hypothetical protein